MVRINSRQGQQQHRQTGIGTLEFVVVLIVVVLLMLFLYVRLEKMAEDVERVTFEGVQNNLQAQLTLKVAYWYAAQQATDAETIGRINPVTLVQHRPSNYAGELLEQELQRAVAERWYFVKDQQWLVYKAKRSANLNNEYSEADVIPFRIKLRFGDPQHKSGIAIAADLTPVYRYEWKKD